MAKSTHKVLIALNKITVMTTSDSKPSKSLTRTLKNFVKSRLLHSVFAGGQRLGFDILPRHFYSEIPDLKTLRSTTSWRKPYTMLGVLGSCTEEQLQWVKGVVTPELRSWLGRSDIHNQACLDNGEEGYGKIEAEFLHCFIKRYQPKTILQVGCGVSTAVCLRAASEISYQPRIICIEPYPTPFLKRSCEAGIIELIKMRLQDVDPVIMHELKAGDLLFVDSSHALGPAGEVTRIMLEFLPRLSVDMFAHFHDIYFPYDYQGGLLNDELFFQHETALLLAFLTLNPHYRIMGSLSMLHHKKQHDLTEIFPHYVPAKFIDGIKNTVGHFPSSIFIRRVLN